nr:histone deacetylase 14 [Tanacetum cinerariifolium]
MFTKLIIHHLQSKHKFHPRLNSPLYLPYKEYILGYLKFSAKGTKREVFGMPILNELITADIQGEQYYKEYLEKVAKHQRYLAGEEGSDPDSPAPKAASVIKPAAAQQPKPKHAPAKSQEKKRKLVTETSNNPCPTKSSKLGLVTKRRKPTRSLSLVDEFADEEAEMQRAVEENLKSVHDAHQGPLPPVVIREPDSGKFQPLPEVQGKKKEKRRTPASFNRFQRFRERKKRNDSESDEEVPLVVKVGAQDEGQAGPNPGVLTEGQAGSMIRSFATSFPNEAEARKIELKLGMNSEEEKGKDLYF